MNVCGRCGLAHPAGQPCPITVSLPAPVTHTPLAPGTVVAGRFRIAGVTHRSGMSTVYRAQDTRDHSIVAVKEFDAACLPPDERAEALAWLAREAALLSMLHDPRLPRLLSVAGEGDRQYVVMPFIEGETLEERVARRGPQPEMLVLGWGRELASLLVYLHGQDPPIIHRDLKPANVLLQPDGSLTLLDLGVARPVAPGVAGTAVGTPGYAPPEQYQGQADERSDLYGLGATLHRALTGYDPENQPPFRHPPVRDLNPAVSVQTASLVASLLKVAPGQRLRRAQGALACLKVAERSAFAQSCGPIVAMYRQMLTLLAVAVIFGLAIFSHMYARPPISAVATARFEPFDPVRGYLGVTLLFVPGLLPLLPLFHRGLRTHMRRHVAARRHYWRAAALLALLWLVSFGTWLLSLASHRWGDLVAVPDALSLPALTTLIAVGIAAAVLLQQHRLLLRRHPNPRRPHWAYVLLGIGLLLCPLLLAMQAPQYPGIPLAQAEEEAQFNTITALAADAHSDLYVLDALGLRERTPDGVFHLLLDFAETCSPFYSPVRFTTMALDPGGHPVLTTSSGELYELQGPGMLVALPGPSTVFPMNTGMTVGLDGTIYFTDPVAGRINAILPHAMLSRLVRVAPTHWFPAAIAAGPGDDLYVVDASSRALQLLSSAGQLRTLAALPLLSTGSPAGDTAPNGGANITLSRDGAGDLYIADGTHLFVWRPDGALTTTALQGVYDAVHTDAGTYLVSGDPFRSLFVATSGYRSSAPVGGTDSSVLRCVALP